MAFVRDYTWATDKTNGVPITASRMDTEFDSVYSNDNLLLAALTTATVSVLSLNAQGNVTLGTGTANSLIVRGASVTLASGTTSISGEALFTSIVTFASNVNFNGTITGSPTIHGNVTLGSGTANTVTLGAGTLTLSTGQQIVGSPRFDGNLTFGTATRNT